jgi:hypothetical protein
MLSQKKKLCSRLLTADGARAETKNFDPPQQWFTLRQAEWIFEKAK